MYCKKCGKSFEEDARYCPFCGGDNYEDDVYNERKRSRGFAVASLVIGILSLIVCCFFSWFGLIGGALAIIFAGVDKYKNQKFSGMAIAGLVLGIIGVVLGITGVIITMSSDSILNWLSDFVTSSQV